MSVETACGAPVGLELPAVGDEMALSAGSGRESPTTILWENALVAKYLTHGSLHTVGGMPCWPCIFVGKPTGCSKGWAPTCAAACPCESCHSGP